LTDWRPTWEAVSASGQSYTLSRVNVSGTSGDTSWRLYDGRGRVWDIPDIGESAEHRKIREEEALARARERAEVAKAIRPLANAFRGFSEYMEKKRKAYEESVAWRPLELD